MAIAEVAINPNACTKSGNLYSRCNLPSERLQPESPSSAVCTLASVSFSIPHVSEARGEEVTLKNSMRRDASLVPLSHQHHNALAFCVLWARAWKADPTESTVRRWAQKAVDRYEVELRNHFEIEEQILRSEED